MKNDLATEIALNMTPVHGEVITHDRCTAFYCGPCQRWVDVPENMTSQFAKARHHVVAHKDEWTKCESPAD